MVRRHLAHRTLRTFLPPSKTLTVCKFGRNVRRVALLDHGRLRPNDVALPQFAHFAIFHFLSQHLGATLVHITYLFLKISNLDGSNSGYNYNSHKKVTRACFN